MTAPYTPSPVPAVTLALHWVTEQELVDASIAAVKVRLPDWRPVEANTEVVLLESFALQIAQEVYAINQLPEVVFEAVLEMNGVIRQPGLPAAGTILIDCSYGLSGTLTLPAGSRFRATLPDSTTADFLTTVDVAVPAGQANNPVPVVADTPGAGPNALAAGAPLSGVAAPTWVEHARVDPSGITGGIDPEDDEDFWTRGAALLRRRPSALVTAQNFADAALEHQEVGRAQAWSAWDGTAAAVGSKLGYVTVCVTGFVGEALTAPVMAAIQADLQAQSQAGLTVVVIAPSYAAVTVTVTATAVPGAAAATVAAGVNADLVTYLSPFTWPFGTAVTANGIIVRVGSYPGVASVTAATGTGWTGPAAHPNGLPAAAPTVSVTVT